MTKLIKIIIFLIFSIPALKAQDSWVKLQNFTGNRSLGVSFSIGNKVYFGQGSSGGANTVNDFEEYDFATQTWKSINTIPGNPLIGGTAFSYKNFGFVGFGQTGPSTFSKAFYKYTPDSNKWVRLADFPGQARNYALSFVIGNKAYVGCGYNGFQTFKDFYSLNLDSNIWTKIADLPGLPRSKPFHFSLGEKGYVLCGNNYTQSAGDNLLKDVYQYDPTTNSWIQIADFPGENREGGISFSFESIGIVAMGLSEVGFSNEIWEYNISSQSWTNRNSFQGASRRNAGYCTINKRGYMIGGNLGSSFTPEMYEYIPISTSVDPLSHSFQKLQFYPNPFKQNFTISGLNENDEYLIEIFDMKGGHVLREKYHSGELNKELKPGSYFLRIFKVDNSYSFSTVIIKNEN